MFIDYVLTEFLYSRSSHQRCSVRTGPATLLKKRHWHRRFPVNFAKFLKASFLEEQLQTTASCTPLSCNHSPKRQIKSKMKLEKAVSLRSSVKNPFLTEVTYYRPKTLLKSDLLNLA